MATLHTIRFPTALGHCDLSWTAEAITHVILLPTEMPSRTGSEPLPSPAPAPLFVLDAINAITQHLRGEPQPLAHYAIGIAEATPFSQAVWRETQRIPCGETRTYGDIARALGNPGAARAVGRALGANPVPLLVPCHRVIGARGELVGFSASGGVSLKARLLALER